MVEDTDVGRDALCHPLAAVEIDGIVAEQYPLEAVQAVHEGGEGQDEQRKREPACLSKTALLRNYLKPFEDVASRRVSMKREL